MSSPQVDWFSQNAPTDPIQAAMARKPIPKTDDWFAANSPAIGPNDPNGNYDFGAFGKVKGARMNGHVATRAEAFHSMDTINGLAQSMAQSVQQHQQAFEDLRKSFTTDQMTKDVMADLAGIAVAGGASKLAGLGRWTALAPQLEKSALGETVQTAAKPVSRDWFAENAPGIGPGTAHVTPQEDALQTSMQDKYGKRYDLPKQDAKSWLFSDGTSAGGEGRSISHPQMVRAVMGEEETPFTFQKQINAVRVDRITMSNGNDLTQLEVHGAPTDAQMTKLAASGKKFMWDLHQKDDPFEAQAKTGHGDFRDFSKAVDEFFGKPGTGLGPGTAHVTDPAFTESKMGEHANHLNGLSDIDLTGADMVGYNNKSLTATPEEAQNRITAGELLRRYRTDPQFKNLADAARMYVHNHTTIGDIDKISLGQQPVHTSGYFTKLTPEEQALPWDVDANTAMFDGTKFGKNQITFHEGTQIAETLSSAIREASEKDMTLWRGVEPKTLGGPAPYAHLKVGDSLDLPLSSFSTSPDTGENFGNTILKLVGPSKHLNIKPFNYYGEGEHLTQGRFEVIGDSTETVGGRESTAVHFSRPGTKIRYITIRQIGTY